MKISYRSTNRRLFHLFIRMQTILPLADNPQRFLALASVNSPLKRSRVRKTLWRKRRTFQLIRLMPWLTILPTSSNSKNLLR